MASASTKNKRSEPEPEKDKRAAGPIFTRRVWTGTGTIEASLFSKEIDGDNGPYQVFSVAVSRSWKTEEGYDSSKASLRPEDLLPMAMFLQEIYSEIVTEQKK